MDFNCLKDTSRDFPNAKITEANLRIWIIQMLTCYEVITKKVGKCKEVTKPMDRNIFPHKEIQTQVL